MMEGGGGLIQGLWRVSVYCEGMGYVLLGSRCCMCRVMGEEVDLCFDLYLPTGILGQIVTAGDTCRTQNQEKDSRWDVCGKGEE